jgi:hypothetical protein
MNEPPKIEDLFASFDSVLDYLIPIGILLAIAFVVVGGYMWISSTGNPDKVKQAQGTLTWAILGLVFILLAGLLIKTLVDYVAGI